MGNVQAVISNTQSSAALLCSQVFAPYGTPLSQNGNQISQYTNKGFTGQYNDPTSGLDYYVSRYYDSVSGVFLPTGNMLVAHANKDPHRAPITIPCIRSYPDVAPIDKTT